MLNWEFVIKECIRVQGYVSWVKSVLVNFGAYDYRCAGELQSVWGYIVPKNCLSIKCSKELGESEIFKLVTT